MRALTDLLSKTRVFVQDSAFLFGVMDETGELQSGQVCETSPCYADGMVHNLIAL